VLLLVVVVVVADCTMAKPATFVTWTPRNSFNIIVSSEFLTTTVHKEKSGFERTALCLLLVIGGAIEGDEVKPYDCDNLGMFPAEDSYRLIVMPENDPFAIYSNVHRVTEAQQMAAFHSSHPRAHWYSKDILAPGRENLFPAYYSNEFRA
jgi:hypothetical protein